MINKIKILKKDNGIQLLKIENSKNIAIQNLTIRNNSQNSGFSFISYSFNYHFFKKDLVYINSAVGLKMENVTFLDQEISFFKILQ